MIKLAKIVYINEQRAELDIQNNTECSDCKSNCSDGFLSFLFSKNNKNMVVALNNSEIKGAHINDFDSFFTTEHKVNDVIGMKLNEGQLFSLSLLLYGLPIVLLTVALILGYLLFDYLNFNADLGGFIGLLIGLILAKKIINYFILQSSPKVTFFK